MSTANDDLLRAMELALTGKWDAAHQIVQQYENTTTAAWIHAVLHKMEGDLGNADRMEHVADEPRAELAAIQTELDAHNSKAKRTSTPGTRFHLRPDPAGGTAE